MGYVRAEEVLPQDIINLIQRYVEGQNIYIPRKEGNKEAWGTKTNARYDLERRNLTIFEEYQNGKNICELADSYYLSEKSIQRIIREERNKKRIS